MHWTRLDDRRKQGLGGLQRRPSETEIPMQSRLAPGHRMAPNARLCPRPCRRIQVWRAQRSRLGRMLNSGCLQQPVWGVCTPRGYPFQGNSIVSPVSGSTVRSTDDHYQSSKCAISRCSSMSSSKFFRGQFWSLNCLDHHPKICRAIACLPGRTMHRFADASQKQSHKVGNFTARRRLRSTANM